MKMEKILNSPVGTILVVLAVLLVCRTLNLVSYAVLRLAGAAGMIGLIAFAYSVGRKSG